MLAFDESDDAGGMSEDAARWLLERQETDGAWRYADDGPVSAWATPMALLALHRQQSDARARQAVQRGTDWLLELRGEQMSLRDRIKEYFTGRKVVELDTTLDGWPWAPGTFAWVEPTAWSLLALKALWPEDPPRSVRGRIREGETMIIDRACPDGGWNYGNGRVLDVDLEPYPDTTALALLALRGRDDPAVQAGFRALDELLNDHASGLSLALAILSRRTWNRPVAELPARMHARYEASGFMDETRSIALAALASAERMTWLGALPA
jgi:hypothetical protein